MGKVACRAGVVCWERGIWAPLVVGKSAMEASKAGWWLRRVERGGRDSGAAAAREA